MEGKDVDRVSDGQTENGGTKGEMGAVVSPGFHPELQLRCSITCSFGINVFG